MQVRNIKINCISVCHLLESKRFSCLLPQSLACPFFSSDRSVIFFFFFFFCFLSKRDPFIRKKKKSHDTSELRTFAHMCDTGVEKVPMSSIDYKKSKESKETLVLNGWNEFKSSKLTPDVIKHFNCIIVNKENLFDLDTETCVRRILELTDFKHPTNIYETIKKAEKYSKITISNAKHLVSECKEIDMADIKKAVGIKSLPPDIGKIISSYFDLVWKMATKSSSFEDHCFFVFRTQQDLICNFSHLKISQLPCSWFSSPIKLELIILTFRISENLMKQVQEK